MRCSGCLRWVFALPKPWGGAQAVVCNGCLSCQALRWGLGSVCGCGCGCGCVSVCKGPVKNLAKSKHLKLQGSTHRRHEPQILLPSARNPEERQEKNFQVPLNSLKNSNFGYIPDECPWGYAQRTKGEERGPIRVLAPSPPIKAPRLWSAAGPEGGAGQDYVSSWLALPCRHVGCRPSCADPPLEGEDRVKPMASKPACLPVLKNTR